MQRKLHYALIVIFIVASATAWLARIERFTANGRPARAVTQPGGIDAVSRTRIHRLNDPKRDNGKANLRLQAAPFNRRFMEMASKAVPGRQKMTDKSPAAPHPITLFMCGDVMTGRGIDQVLPYPSDPILYEPYMKNARGYVEIAEQANGPIPQPAGWAYIWGDAIDELERVAPDLRIINLETSITKKDSYWKNKGIHYRMHPANRDCLTAAKIDYCSLANNHLLDWGYSGLLETLDTLRQADIKSAGAGRNLQEAQQPAVFEIGGKGRVVVFSYGVPTSGIPLSWAAAEDRPGVNLLKELSAKSVQAIKQMVAAVRQARDIVVVSIHWGGNWGYQIPSEHITFAHQLIDEGGVDVIHGHSSHHIKGIEVYHHKPILYGCGDFINDYEGIRGHEEFRADLGLMYFASLDPSTGKLVQLVMTPTRIKNFKVNRVSEEDRLWLKNVLDRESKRFGTRIEFGGDNTLNVRWD